MILDTGNRKVRSRERGNTVFVSVILAIAGILLLNIAFTGISAKTYDLRSTITVDGDPSDWTGVPPTTANSYAISNGEYIWNDSSNDERTDFTSGNPDPRVDLLEFRVTGDSNYIYFMAKFKDLDDNGTVYIGDNGATFMAITIDNGSAGGETWFSGSSDTQVNVNASWEYQIVVNLADSRYTGKNLTALSYPLNESTANWGSIFYVVNNSWNFQAFTGDTGQYGLMAVNLTLNTIEIKVAWSVLGLDPSTSPTIHVSVITARGWSDYSTNQANTWDISGASDALDCFTTLSDTWSEVQDGVVDNYATITFDTTGNVSNGGVVSEISYIVFLAPLGIAFVLRRFYF